MDQTKIDLKELKLGNEKIVYKDGVLTRFYDIKSNDDKNFYFKADQLPEKMGYYYLTRGKGPDDKNYKNGIKLEYGYSENWDRIMKNSIIDQLNTVKNHLLKNLSYYSKVPDVKDQKYYNLNIHIKKDGKLSRILEYQNSIADLSFENLEVILNNCKINMLIQVKQLIITESNAFLSLRLARVFVDNLNDIKENDLLINILDDLSRERMENIRNIENLEKININHKYVTKKEVRENIMNIVS